MSRVFVSQVSVRKARIGVLLAALILVLAACGRVSPPSGTTGTASPTPNESPSAAPTPLTISGPSFPMGEVGLTYAPITITAGGGNAPYILWRVSGGALPGGLSFSPDGVISGAPTAGGTFNFTLEVTDATMATATLDGSIKVASRLVANYINHAYNVHTGYPILNVCVQPRADHPCPNPDDRAIQFASVSGGVAPYTYALASGTLPPMSSLNRLGLSWNPNSYGPGQLSMGDYPITIRVTDSLGASVIVGGEYWLYRT